MELDDLKTSWKDLETVLAETQALQFHLVTERKLDRIHRGLRPLRWGQGLQIACGALLALWGGGFWVGHPRPLHLLVTGVVMHAYGLAMILFGARVLALAARLDFGAPVVEIQRGIAELRGFYGRGYAWLGLPWWVLWMVFLEMAFMSLFGADLYANLGAAVPITLTFCGLGWAGSLVLAAWARRHPGHGPRFLALVEGRSLTRARAVLEELARFEAEDRKP